MSFIPLDFESLKKLNLNFDSKFNLIREYAKENNVPIIQDEGLSFLESIIRIKKPKKILEIGTAIGYSASRMALVSNSDVTTIERDINMYNEALKNIKLLNLENNINVIFKDALEIENELDGMTFDLIFIDAAKGQSIKFFEKFSKYLSGDGIIITDNMNFHGLLNTEIKSRNLKQLVRKIKEYHTFLENNLEFNTSIYNLGDGIALSIKK